MKEAFAFCLLWINLKGGESCFYQCAVDRARFTAALKVPLFHCDRKTFKKCCVVYYWILQGDTLGYFLGLYDLRLLLVLKHNFYFDIYKTLWTTCCGTLYITPLFLNCTDVLWTHVVKSSWRYIVLLIHSYFSQRGCLWLMSAHRGHRRWDSHNLCDRHLLCQVCVNPLFRWSNWSNSLFKLLFCLEWNTLQKLVILSLAGNGKLTARRIWTGA